MARFAGKTVIVTGAGSGIGQATARRFASEGANVLAADQDADGLAETLKGLDTARVVTRIVDVSDQAQVEAMVEAAVERFGALHVIHNNAGVGCDGTVETMTLDDYRKVMAVNVDGVLFGCRAAYPELKKTRGCIVNTASISGIGGDTEMLGYNISKGAVANLTRALARDLGRDGIRVVSIIPGNVQTPRQERWYTPEGEADIVAAQCLDGRIQPADVAALVLFLASDDARMCTGHPYVIDAGWR